MASSTTRIRRMRVGWMLCGACGNGSTVLPRGATRLATGGVAMTSTTAAAPVKEGVSRQRAIMARTVLGNASAVTVPRQRRRVYGGDEISRWPQVLDAERMAIGRIKRKRLVRLAAHWPSLRRR